MQHKFPEAEEISKKQNSKRVAAKDYTAEEYDHLYTNKRGEVIQPASHIESCMVKAANEFFIKGHKGKRFSDRVKAFVEVQPAEIVHKIQDWHARFVVIQRNRVLRWRPCLPSWSLAFQVVLKDPEAVPSATVHEILEYGGRYIGIGDYRPKFGQFEVTKWAEQS